MKSPTSNFTDVSPVGAALIHAVRQTDGQANVIGAFRDYANANAPKISIQLGILCPFADPIYDRQSFIVVKILLFAKYSAFGKSL
jgi:hypothetical protein